MGKPWWQTLVASLGGVVGLLLFLSPAKAVLRARSERVLGDLNPLPFPALLANCMGWVVYASVTDDVLVLWPNFLGFLLALFYTLSCFALADTKTRDRQTAILLFFATALMVVGSVGAMCDFSQDKLKNTWGFTANAILLIFYASPLSTVFEVLRTRCSASLQLPLSVMNVVNGTLWLVYGLAISDYFIAVPNGVGAVLGIIYCALIFIFPRKSAKRSPACSDTQSSRRELMATAGTEEMDAVPAAVKPVAGDDAAEASVMANGSMIGLARAV